MNFSETGAPQELKKKGRRMRENLRDAAAAASEQVLFKSGRVVPHAGARHFRTDRAPLCAGCCTQEAHEKFLGATLPPLLMSTRFVCVCFIVL